MRRSTLRRWGRPNALTGNWIHARAEWPARYALQGYGRHSEPPPRVLPAPWRRGQAYRPLLARDCLRPIQKPSPGADVAAGKPRSLPPALPIAACGPQGILAWRGAVATEWTLTSPLASPVAIANEFGRCTAECHSSNPRVPWRTLECTQSTPRVPQSTLECTKSTLAYPGVHPEHPWSTLEYPGVHPEHPWSTLEYPRVHPEHPWSE